MATEEFASTQKGTAEQTDVPPESDLSPAEADKANNTTGDQYYLFGPDRLPIGPNGKPVRTGEYEPWSTCKELLSDYDPERGKAPKFAEGTGAGTSSKRSARAAPSAGSKVLKVPEGVLVVEGEAAPNQPPQIKRFFVIEDDSALGARTSRTPSSSSTPTPTPRWWPSSSPTRGGGASPM